MMDHAYGRLGRSGRTPGAPSWWDRGYLPHFESQDHIQHVCFRLADSLPREVVDRILLELGALPAVLREAEKEKRFNAYLDAGHGACWLQQPHNAGLVQDAFLLFHGVRYVLHAWCVMPNHVHVLFQPMNGWTMSKVVASWKSYTGRRISAWRQQDGHDPGGPVWQREYFDRYVRNEQHYDRVVAYIRDNPVTAGLVERPEDWVFSSAGYARQIGQG